MYAYIKGELTEIDIDYIVIETGGIGYRIFIPAKTFEYLPPVGEAGFRPAGIGGVEVGNVRPGVTGVHHAEVGHDPVIPAQIEQLRLRHVPYAGDIPGPSSR